jgi:cobalt/nickel transport system permease protein
MLHGFGPLFAVHISDGILQSTWLAGGFVVAILLAIVGAWRLRDEEIPTIALLTAAFFVASSIHIRVGPTSWHLLLNGLVGVLLGRRAALAIPIGLVLQYFLLTHGGFYTLGINTCILLLPALLASVAFTTLRNAPRLRQAWFRNALIGISGLAWALNGVYSVTLLVSNHLLNTGTPELDTAAAVTLHPATLAGALLCALVFVWLAGRLKTAPEFALGLVVGEVTVLVTIGLNYLVLVRGGDQVDWTLPARILLVLHLPIAVLEGVVLGFLVGFLARVKPELLGMADGRFADAHRPASAMVVGDSDAGRDGPGGPGAHVDCALPRVASGQGADRELLSRRQPSR